MGKKVELTCIQCGKHFNRELGEVNRKRKPKTGPFCSKACHNKFRCSGKPLSEEHKTKLRGKVPWNRGKRWSPRIRQKISEATSKGQRMREKNPNWKGGRYVNKQGFVIIRVNGRPIQEHKHIIQQYLGRLLTKGEVIHHKNGNRQDNRIENLQMMTISEHMQLHHPNGIDQKLREKTCIICGTKFKGRHNALLCSERCRRLRNREYWRKYDAKRRGNIAKIVAS